MKAINYLQCSECLKVLNEFKELNEVDEGRDANLLAEYVLFAEMKRLKAAQEKSFVDQKIKDLRQRENPITSTWEFPPTITC